MLTPPDDGCIHDGMLRQTLLDLKDVIKSRFNVEVKEREFSIQELINSSREGRLIDMFGLSSLSKVRKINRVCYRDTTILMNHENAGKFSDGITNLLDEVMRGDEKHPWITTFE